MALFKPVLSLLLLLIFSLSVSARLDSTEITTFEEAEKAIDTLTLKIEKSPTEAELYVSRGDIYFLIHEFDSAEEDYSKAILINDNLDAAYYGRMMISASFSHKKVSSVKR